MNKNILNSINMRELGKELQQARSKRGLTQAEAAKIIDVARTTLTAIEKGTRRIKSGELIKLARAYGRQVNDFVASRPKIESFAVQFRASVQPNEEAKEIEEAIALLEELSRNYLELEQITGSPLVRKYPLEYDIAELPAKQAAEGVAQEERNRLGLGDGPIPILRDILEQDVGLRIFYIPMQPSSKFAGIYHYDDKLGGCIAVNVLHRIEERRRWTLAHDYGHFLGHRYKSAVSYWHTKRERFADYFANHFLMPTSGLMRRYNDIKRARGKITPAYLLTLAHYYGVSFRALLSRLEEMKLLSSSARDKLQRGIKVRQAQQQLGFEPLPMTSEKLPVYYRNLAVQAYDKGLISEGQFAKFLQVDRVEARSVVEKLRQYDDDTLEENRNMKQEAMAEETASDTRDDFSL